MRAIKTSIYLSNRAITAVCGETRADRLAVSRCLREDIPAGLVSRGAILNADALAVHLDTFLIKLGGQPGRLSLVIDGDAMLCKVLDVPALPAKKMRELLKAELTLERPNDFLHDFSVISRGEKGAGGRIFALAAERTRIEPFAALFARLRVPLRGIDVTQSCATRLFSLASEYSGMSFISAHADGNEIVSMLFQSGEFSFADRKTLNERRGTPAAAVEISHALHSMVQYAYLQRDKAPLTHAFLSGLLGEETQFTSDIGDALGLAVSPPLETGVVSFAGQLPPDWGQYLFCLGDLLG